MLLYCALEVTVRIMWSTCTLDSSGCVDSWKVGMTEVGSNEWLGGVLKLLKGVWCARRRHGRFNVLQAQQHLSIIASDSALLNAFVSDPNIFQGTSCAPYRKLRQVLVLYTSKQVYCRQLLYVYFLSIIIAPLYLLVCYAGSNKLSQLLDKYFFHFHFTV